MKVITMTAYRRPQNTREVLDTLAQCDGIGDWTLLPNVEPGNAEVIAALREFNACECRLVVNERRLGLNRNTLNALMRAFHLKADHVVHLEDDTVPSPDAAVFRVGHRPLGRARSEAHNLAGLRLQQVQDRTDDGAKPPLRHSPDLDALGLGRRPQTPGVAHD